MQQVVQKSLTCCSGYKTCVAAPSLGTWYSEEFRSVIRILWPKLLPPSVIDTS
jgi:hypothetical protein